jgi:hypothetical protein
VLSFFFLRFTRVMEGCQVEPSERRLHRAISIYGKAPRLCKKGNVRFRAADPYESAERSKEALSLTGVEEKDDSDKITGLP